MFLLLTCTLLQVPVLVPKVQVPVQVQVLGMQVQVPVPEKMYLSTAQVPVLSTTRLVW